MVLIETLTSERIYLRTLTNSEANEQYRSWLCDPEVNRFLATKSATIQELCDYIKQKNEQSDALFYGIFWRASDEFIGTIKLEPINISEHKAVIAIMVGDKNYWGKGVAGEAMGLLMNYAFTELGILEMELGVIGQNVSAIRAYEKLGFKEVKREIGKVRYEDEVLDQVTMRLFLGKNI